jgi:hypothetical protein
VWFLSDRWDVYGQNPDTDRTDVSRLSSGLVGPLDGPLDDLVSDVIGQKNGEFFTRSFVRGQPSISVCWGSCLSHRLDAHASVDDRPLVYHIQEHADNSRRDNHCRRDDSGL